MFVTLLLCQLHTSAQGKNFIRGLRGEDSLSVDRVWLGSMIVPGYGQAYNRQYWKIPVIYAGMGSMAYLGYHFNDKQQDAWNVYQNAIAQSAPDATIASLKDTYNSYRTQRNLAYVGAALFYVGGALDAVYQYKTTKPIVPAKPTIYSTLVPGLGQIYNGEYWKVPIVYGGLAFCGYLINFNNVQYHRYRDAYNDVSNKIPDEFNGQFSASDLKYFRDGYRRNRDYSILVTGLIYVLNIVDAHVFAHLADYDVSDNLSMRFEPTLFTNQTFAVNPNNFTPSVGFNLTITLK